MFTLESTYNEIMEDDHRRRYMELLIPSFIFTFVKENQKNHTLEQMKKEITMPWGGPFLAEDLLYAANFIDNELDPGQWKCISLWKEAEGTVPYANGTKDSVCLFTSVSCQNDERKRPAAVICPGGGYSCVSMIGEGLMYAKRMEKRGYHPFVLNYRVAPNHYPDPQMDLLLAISHVRANAAAYGIDPDDLVLMGSSAGGHLCASTAAFCREMKPRFEEEIQRELPAYAEKYKNVNLRPDKLSLSYPVISFMEEGHEESFLNISGGDESLREKLSVERQVDETYPKTFIWACEDDPLVPYSNGSRLCEALNKMGVPVKWNLYPNGGHGCGLAEGTSAEEWIDSMLMFMENEGIQR